MSRIKLTPEEKKVRAQERTAEKQALRKKFPGAYVGTSGDVYIRMEAGEDYFIGIRIKSTSGAWQSFSIILNKPGEIMELITALTARYNHQIDELNEEAGRCGLKKAIHAKS